MVSRIITSTFQFYRKQSNMRLILLLATLFTVLPAQALFNAGVNRTIIADYETVELTLRSDTNSNSAPDLSLLKKDFDIIGTRQSKQARFINGKSESWRDWVVTLMPKRTGNITIPSLALGSERSQPINISVRNDLNNNRNGTGKPVLIQTEVSSEGVYVQQEIIFTMQILYRVSLYDESRLTPLSIDNALVQQLGETEKFDTVFEGSRYQVFQLRYSIHPQQEGILEIPPLTFTGSMASNNDPFGSFFSSNGKPIVVRSEPVFIDVNPRPESYPQQNWLPARNLRLQEMWSQPLESLKAGDAITRTITIEADGLSAAQLSPVFLAQPEGVNSYPDKSGSEDLQTPSGIRGQRTDAIAMIPTRPGKLTLPAVKYTWFNTDTGSTEVAEIPERILDVAPATTDSSQLSAPVIPQEAPAQEAPECPTPAISTPAQSDSQNHLWRTIALLLAVLWLITGIVWWRGSRNKRHNLTTPNTQPVAAPINSEINEKNAFVKLEAACKAGNLAMVREKLQNWCEAYLNQSESTSIEQCLQQMNSQPLSEFYHLLDTHLYSGSSELIDVNSGIDICRAIRQQRPNNSDSDLNDLYPQ